MSKQLLETITNTTKDLLDKLGVPAKSDVVLGEEDDAYRVQIETAEAGVLIGKHGETLNALQVILKQIIYAKTQENLRLIVNVGDWAQKREETLTRLAQSCVAKVKETGRAEHVYELSAAERRFVHILLQESNDVVTESEGEGRERHLVIKPKTS